MNWVYGIGSGILLSAINYWLWTRIVVRLTAIEPKGKLGLLLLFLLKIGLNFLAIGVLVGVLKIDLLAMLVGVGFAMLGLVIGGTL